MVSTMDKNKVKHKKVYLVLSSFIVFALWNLLSLHFSPLIVPPMGKVIDSLIAIFTGSELYTMILITIVRLLVGLTVGVVLGLLIGVLMGYFEGFKELMSPIVGLFQTIPPVSWVVLALVWFGFNGKPAMFIVATSTFPIIAINVCEGILNIDKRLVQMSKLYHFSEKKRLIHVTLPSITPYFSSAFKVALGSGWKIAVMGEVLTTSDGIGGMIKLARLNVEPEYIIAWSIIIIMLFYLSDFILRKLILSKIDV